MADNLDGRCGGNARKRICVIIAQIEENTQNHFMHGFLKKAYEFDYDVCVFSMYLKYQDSTFRGVGDSNIYSLINFDLFDAVVLCQDTVQTPGIAEKLQKRIQSEFHGGVVVVVDKESEAFHTIMMDHYTPIVKLVDHLVDVHGYRNIYFLNGLKGHIHSEQRLKGYMDGMKAHGIPVTDDMIYYGTYWYDSGDYMVDELVKDREHLPDAIVCANDCMAIGVCTAFERYGIHVPDDIAVVGYDSIEDGRNSPVPITSADIPAEDCGQYCMEYVHAELEGRCMPDFKTNVDLYVGGTCGCCGWEKDRIRVRRDHWATDLSATSFYSCFNNLMDDLVAQTSAEAFINTVFQYVYQIRPFNSFHLCLNSYWRDPEVMTGEEALRYGYTDQVYRVIKCGAKEGCSAISYEDVFSSDILLPELYEDRDYPTAFIFTPLFFQDRSFGYAVVNYGREPRVYEEVYRSWIKTVSRDMESFSRHEGLGKLLERIESGQVRDGLTGMYNYRGFMGQTEDLIKRANAREKAILITAIDLKNTRKINNLYGRTEGDKTLQYVAQILGELLDPEELSMRMGDDEFIVASLVAPGDTQRGEYIIEELNKRFDKLREEKYSTFDIGVYYGYKSDVVTTVSVLEHLLNEAVNVKNHAKAKLGSKGRVQKTITEEDLKRDEVVDKILDENLLVYHFQPIVNAQDGEIFAYEALMRVSGPVKLSPPQILESAARLGRLYDVERYTLFNVVDYVDRHPDMFRGRKVFINSMPGHMLDASDRRAFVEKVKKLECDGIVIEFTEGDELNDEELLGLKTFLKSNGIEFAIDDYGSGYSNVNNLLRYMPNYVKIDRMLLTGIDTDPHRQHFVRNIIEFTEDNDIIALAEGIETTKEMKTVIQLGTNLIQGYYTAKPDSEVIQQIAEQVAYEIIQYNQSSMLTDNNRIYVMEHEDSVSLLKLTTDNYREIVVRDHGDGENNLRIVGAPGFNSDISISIEDGFKGTIVLQNASFAGERMMPCIDCGENVELSLVLEGYNICRTGGIRVPETSSLTVEGEGDLKISLSSSRYYGIGNDLKSKHGRLSFIQDGSIEITANGMNGVAIGSGYGGDIQIGKGRYDIRLYGQSGVAIGSVYEAATLELKQCDMDIVFDTSHGVVIGSVMETADVSIVDSSVMIKSSGNRYTAVGTLEGDGCKFSVRRVHMEMNMRGRDGKAIGSKTGYVDVEIADAYVQVSTQGANSLLAGSEDGLGSFESRNAELMVTVKNGDDRYIAIPESDVRLINCKYMFMVNNENIERQVIEDYD